MQKVEQATKVLQDLNQVELEDKKFFWLVSNSRKECASKHLAGIFLFKGIYNS